MTSDQLADEVSQFVAECAVRIRGVGKDQYEGKGYQKFETMEMDELFEYMEEELRDVANYAVFLAIRLRRIRTAFGDFDDLGTGTEEEYEAGDITADYFKDGGDDEATHD